MTRPHWRNAPQNAAKRPGDRNGWPIQLLQSRQDERTAWLEPASEKVRQWREEDRKNGIEWGAGQ